MIDSGLKEKLLDALEDAVANYNAGLDEPTAIAKSASDKNLNKAQTERLVEMYNTSRTLHHFDTHKNEKAASFPLVDKKEVLDLLFDVTGEKEASEFRQPAEPSVGYEEPEDDFFACKSAEEFDFDSAFTPSERDVPNLETNSYRMSRQLSRLQKEADHMNAEAGVETERARQKLSKLAGILTTCYSTGDMHKIAAVVGYLSNRPECIEVFRGLAAHLPEYVLSCPVKLANVIDDNAAPREIGLIHEIVQHEANAEEFKKSAKERLDACKQASEQFNTLVTGQVAKNETANEMDRFVSGDFRFNEKQAAGFGAGMVVEKLWNQALPAVADLRATPKAVEKEVDDASKRLVNVHREMILTDLVNNDPYLSSEDPKTIAAYYSNFAELSPELANNKEVVRSVLRQAVHNGGGGYSPFDAGSFMDAEKTLKEIRGTLPPKVQIKQDAKDKK